MPRRMRMRHPHALGLCMALAMGCAFAEPAPDELPTGLDVKVGDVEQRRSGNALTIEQASDHASLDWASFSVGEAARVEFKQPNPDSVALNRVRGGEASRIHGRLEANGNVFLVNPAGIYFGPHSRVDVGGLVASTLAVADAQPPSQRFAFAADSTGEIVHAGEIIARNVAFFGGQLEQIGTVIATKQAHYAAGDAVALELDNDIGYRVDNRRLNELQRAGLAAQFNDQILTTDVITRSLEGEVVATEAQSATTLAFEEDGEPRLILAGETQAPAIRASAGDEGSVRIAGVLDASSRQGPGGDIAVEGGEIEVAPAARLAADGVGGGGRIRVGGGVRGADTDISNAEQTVVADGAVATADAVDTGTGGEVVFWADGATAFNGHVSAQGGNQQGDGGFVEVSGKRFLDFQGTVDLSAAAGDSGVLLLDPTNLEIRDQQSGNKITQENNIWEPGFPGITSVLTVSQLQNSLNTSNVIVRTIGSGEGAGQAGHITVVDEFDGLSSSNLLHLQAAGDIRFEADVVSANGTMDLWAQAKGEVIQQPGVSLGTIGSPLNNVRLTVFDGIANRAGIRTGDIDAAHIELEPNDAIGGVQQHVGSQITADEVVLLGDAGVDFDLSADNRIGKIAGFIDGDLTLRNTRDLIIDKNLTTNIGRNQPVPELWSGGGDIMIESTDNISGVHVNTRQVRGESGSGAGDLTIRLIADNAHMSLGGLAGPAKTTIFGGLAHIKAENGTTTFATTGSNSDLLVGGFSSLESGGMGDITFSASQDLIFGGGASNLNGGTIRLNAGRDIRFKRNISATSVVAETDTKISNEAAISALSLAFLDDLTVTLPAYTSSEVPNDVDLSTADNSNPYVNLRGSLTIDAPDSNVRVRAKNSSSAQDTVTLADIDASNLELVAAPGTAVAQAAGSRLRVNGLILVGGGAGGFALDGNNIIDDLAGNTQAPVEIRHTDTIIDRRSGFFMKALTGGISGTSYTGLTTNNYDFAVTTDTNFSFDNQLSTTLLDVGSATVTIADGAGASDGISLGLDTRSQLSIGGGLRWIAAAETIFDTRASGHPIYVNGINEPTLGSLTFLSGDHLDFIGSDQNPAVVHGAMTAETPGLLTILENVESQGPMRLTANSIFAGEDNAITLSAAGAGSDLTLDAPVTWNSRELRLKAGRDIRLEGMVDGRPKTATETAGSLSLRYGLATVGGVANGREARVRIHAPVRLPKGNNFSTRLGSGSSLQNYYVITEIGAEGSTTRQDLQGIGTFTDFALGTDIDASATQSWNNGKGFKPIGGVSGYMGNFFGLGNTISNLHINRPGEDYIGLFSSVAVNPTNPKELRISHFNIEGADIVGEENVGMVSGGMSAFVSGGTPVLPVLTDITVSGKVRYTNQQFGGRVGGVVGDNDGRLERVQVLGSIEPLTDADRAFVNVIGGISGFNNGLIKDSFSDVDLIGWNYAGGVAGINGNEASVENVIAIGRVTGSSIQPELSGELFGQDEGTTSRVFDEAGADAYTQSKYGNLSSGQWSGFDFDDTWYSVDGSTLPMLRNQRYTRVSDGRQLQLMRARPSSDYKLVADLDLTNAMGATKGLWRDGFVPIGDASTEGAFTGSLDGHSKTITGLVVNRDENLTDGLLGDFNGGTVSSLTLENADLTAGDGQNGDDGNITVRNGVTLTGTVNLNAGTGNVSVNQAIGSNANPATSVSISGMNLNLPAVTTSSAQTYQATGTITATGDLTSQGGSSEIMANHVQFSPNQAFAIDMGSLTLDAPLQQLGNGGISITADAITFPDTIETRGGPISLTARYGGITAFFDNDSSPAILRTRATADSGQASGAILLDAESANDTGFIGVGSLDAAGADHSAGAGSHGGDITLKSDGGITYSALSVGGGDGSGASGGNSGDILLQTDDNVGLSLPGTPLRAIGGSGSTAGSDGIITLEARGNGGITQPADGAEIQAQRLNLASHTTGSPLTNLTGEIALVDADNKVDVLGVNTFKGTADATGQTLRFVNDGDLTLKGWRSSGFYAEGPLEIDVGSGHLTLDAAIQSPVGGLTATGRKFTATSNGTIDYSAGSGVDLDFSRDVEINAAIATGGGDLSVVANLRERDRIQLRIPVGESIATSGGNINLVSNGGTLHVRSPVVTGGGDFHGSGKWVTLRTPQTVGLRTSGGDVTLNATDDGSRGAYSIFIEDDILTGGGSLTGSGYLLGLDTLTLNTGGGGHGGAINFNIRVEIDGKTHIKTGVSGEGITFGKSVRHSTSTFSQPAELLLQAGTGGIVFKEPVGGPTALYSVFIEDAAAVTAEDSFRAGRLVIRASGNLNFTDSGNDFNKLALELTGKNSASIVDQDTLEIASITRGSDTITGLTATGASSAISLTVGGALTQASGATITTPGNLTIDTTALDADDVTLRNDASGGTTLGNSLVAGTLSINATQDDVRQASGARLRAGKLVVTNKTFDLDRAEEQFFADGIVAPGLSYFSAADALTVRQSGSDITVSEVNGTGSLTFDGSQTGRAVLISDSLDRAISSVTDGSAVQLSEANDIGGEIQLTTAGQYTESAVTVGNGSIDVGALESARSFEFSSLGGFRLDAGTDLGGGLMVDAGKNIRLRSNGDDDIVSNGAISLTADERVGVIPGVQLLGADDIHITATGASSHSGVGVRIRGNSSATDISQATAIIASGNGSVVIDGTGGSVSDTTNAGVRIGSEHAGDENSVLIGAVSGDLTITGTAGTWHADSETGVTQQAGLSIRSATLRTTAGGAITLTGTGPTGLPAPAGTPYDDRDGVVIENNVLIQTRVTNDAGLASDYGAIAISGTAYGTGEGIDANDDITQRRILAGKGGVALTGVVADQPTGTRPGDGEGIVLRKMVIDSAAGPVAVTGQSGTLGGDGVLAYEDSLIGSSLAASVSINGTAVSPTGDGIDLERTALEASGAVSLEGTAVGGPGIEITATGSGMGEPTISAGEISLKGRSDSKKGVKIHNLDDATAGAGLTIRAESGTADRAVDIRESDFSVGSATIGGIDTPYATARHEGVFFDDSRLIATGPIVLKGKATTAGGGGGIVFDWDKNAVASNVLVKGASITLDGQSTAAGPGVYLDEKVQLETTAGSIDIMATSTSGAAAVTVNELTAKTGGGAFNLAGALDIQASLSTETTGGAISIVDAVTGSGTMYVDAGAGAVSFQDDYTAGVLTLANASHAVIEGDLQVPRLVTANQAYSLSLLGGSNWFSLPIALHNSGVITLGDSASDTFVFNGGVTVTGTETPVSLHGVLRASATGGASPGEDLDFDEAAVMLTGSTTLDLTNDGATTPGVEDDIWIGSLSGSGSDYAHDLTLIAGAGDIRIDGGSGAFKVGDITVVSARNFLAGSLEAARFKQSAGRMTSFFGAPSFAATSGAPAFEFDGEQLTVTGALSAPGSEIWIDAVDVGLLGALTSNGLNLTVSRSLSLDAGPHNVDRLAVAIAHPGHTLSFNNTTALSVGSVGGLSGLNTNNGRIALQAEDLDLAEAVHAGSANVTLKPAAANAPVTLGTESGVNGRLELTAEELGRITAGKLVIGSDSTGAITVNTSDVGPAGTVSGDWVLAGSSVSQTSSGSVDFSGGLRLDIEGDVHMDSNTNDVDALASTAAPNPQIFAFKDADDLRIDTVDGVSGVTANGPVDIEAPSLTVMAPINTTAATFPTIADITLTGSVDLGVDFVTAGADITLGASGASKHLIGGARRLDTGGGAGDITVIGSLNGAQAFTIEAGTGDVTLQGAIGNTTPLTSMSISSGDDLSLSDVTTTGAQVYGVSATTRLGGMLATAGNGITLNGGIVLTGAAGMDTTSNGAAPGGASINLPIAVTSAAGSSTSFTLDAGTSNLSIQAVTTTDAQHYTADAITLAGDLTTTAGDVRLNGPIHFDGLQAIDTTGSGAVSTGGDVHLNDTAFGDTAFSVAAPGKSVRLANIQTDSIAVNADRIQLAGDDYSANAGDITLGGSVELTPPGMTATLDASAMDGDITMADVDDPGGSTTLRVVTGGDVTVNGEIGATDPLAGLVFDVGGLMANQAISLTANGMLTVDNDGSGLLTGVIAGSDMSFVKNGSGTLLLGSSNSFSGPTSVLDGTLQISSDGSLGPAPGSPSNGHLTLHRGTLSVANSFDLAANRRLTISGGGGTIAVADGEALRYEGVLRGNAALTKTGAGELRLTGDSNFTGPTTIADGTLAIDPSVNTFRPLGSGAVTNNGALFLDFDTNGAFTQPLTGTGTLRIRYTGVGNAFFLANASHTGGTEITGGLALGNGTGPGRLGSGDITLKTADTRLTFQIATNGETVFANRITGAGSLRKNGADRITLTGANDYQGRTVIDQGTLQIGNGTAAGSPGTGGLELLGGDLVIDRPGELVLANRIEGPRHLVHRGAGRLVLTGRAAYSGATRTPGGGAVVFQHDLLPATSAFRGSGDITIEPDGSQFSGVPVVDYTLDQTLAGLTVGKQGSGADLTVVEPIRISGPITLYGGGLSIDAPIDIHGHDLALHASGGVGQTEAIVAETLALQGTGAFTLDHAQNSIATLAAGQPGQAPVGIDFVNSTALEVGSINPDGVHSIGNVRIETLVGDLTITEDIITTSNDPRAIVLNAGKNADAGDASGGNLILEQSPSISAGPHGGVRLLTGRIDQSLGLAESGSGAGDGLIGFASGNFRYGSDEQLQAYQKAVPGDATVAIYREKPSLAGSIDDQVLTYGETPAMISISQAQGLKNGDGFSGELLNERFSGAGYLQAGNYTTHANGPADLGYDVSAVQPGVVSVERRPITVDNVAVHDRRYDAGTTAQVAGGELGAGRLSGDQVVVSDAAASGVFAQADVGVDIPVTASGFALSGADKNNYRMIQPTGLTGNISPAPLRLVGEKIYDGETAMPGSGLVAEGVGDESFSVTGAGGPTNLSQADVQTNVPLQSVAGLALGAGRNDAQRGNYQPLTTEKSTVSVKPRPITLAVNDKTRVYGDALPLGRQPANEAVRLVAGSMAGAEQLDSVLVSSTNAIAEDPTAAVGTYGAELIADGALGSAGFDVANYDVTYVAGALEVTPRDLQIRANSDRQQYDGGAYRGGNGIVSTGFANNEGLADLGGALEYRGTSQGAVDAGVYTIEPAGLVSGNYTITYIPGRLTIDPADLRRLEVSLDGVVEKTYDGNAQATLSPDNFRLSGWIGDDDARVVKSAGTYESRHAGVGKSVVVELERQDYQPVGDTNLDNYSLPIIAEGDVGRINPRPLTIRPTADSKVYDGTRVSDERPVAEGLVGRDQLGEALQAFTDANADADKGLEVEGYSVVDGNGGENYNVQLATANDGQITPRPIAITAAAAEKVYGAADPAFSYENAPALVSDDRFTGEIQRADGEAVGRYTLTLGKLRVLDGAGGSNYRLSFSPAPLEITRRPLVIQAREQARVHGQTSSLDATAFALGGMGLANGERIGAVELHSQTGKAGDETAPAGRYSDEIQVLGVTRATGFDAKNYAIRYEAGDLIVQPPPQNLAQADPQIQRALSMAGRAQSPFHRQVNLSGRLLAIDGMPWRQDAAPSLCSADAEPEECPYGDVALNLGDGE